MKQFIEKINNLGIATNEISISYQSLEKMKTWSAKDWASSYKNEIPKEIYDENLIKGCQSKVWLNSSFKNNIVIFEADSDAIISKGIISLLIRVFSGHRPEDILEAKIDFIEKIGLNTHLSQTRANGLLAMIKQIKIYALAYQSKK